MDAKTNTINTLSMLNTLTLEEILSRSGYEYDELSAKLKALTDGTRYLSGMGTASCELESLYSSIHTLEVLVDMKSAELFTLQSAVEDMYKDRVVEENSTPSIIELIQEDINNSVDALDSIVVDVSECTDVISAHVDLCGAFQDVDIVFKDDNIGPNLCVYLEYHVDGTCLNNINITCTDGESIDEVSDAVVYLYNKYPNTPIYVEGIKLSLD